MRVLSSSQYKYTTFFAEIQIPLTFRNTLGKLKCGDLQQRAFGACYITRSTWKVGILLHERGAQRVNTHRFRDRAKTGWAFVGSWETEKRAARAQKTLKGRDGADGWLGRVEISPYICQKIRR